MCLTDVLQPLPFSSIILKNVQIFVAECNQVSSWTGITENAERRIRHNCTPLQIVHRIPNVKNKNVAL